MTNLKLGHNYFLSVADDYSKNGTCDRARVGAVIVKDNKVIGMGYNDSIEDHDTCDDVGHFMDNGHCIRTIHAEANAILNSDRDQLVGSICYVTHSPCKDCIKQLNQVGVIEVYYRQPYRENPKYDLFQDGIKLTHFLG